MKKIDLDTWERRSHYEWFSAFPDPTVAVDLKLRITPVLSVCRERGLSSFAMLMYMFTTAVNSSRAFRLRVLDGAVCEIEHGNAGYTYMVSDTVFVNCRARCGQGFRRFLEDVEENTRQYRNSGHVPAQYNDTTVVDDVYISCTPWYSFLSVRQPVPCHCPESLSIPRLCWGKYYEENGEMYTNLQIMANHALVDGVDFAHVLAAIEAQIADAEVLADEA